MSSVNCNAPHVHTADRNHNYETSANDSSAKTTSCESGSSCSSTGFDYGGDAESSAWFENRNASSGAGNEGVHQQGMDMLQQMMQMLMKMLGLSNENEGSALDHGDGFETGGHDHGASDVGSRRNLPENPQEMSNAQAKQVLLDEFDNAEIRKNGGDRDGIIGTGDLQKLADDPSTDPHLREAAQRALDDPSFSGGMDTKDGDTIHLTKDSIRQSIVQDERLQSDAETLLKEFDNVEIRALGGDRDGKIGQNDLEKLISDPMTDPALADAARGILDKMQQDGTNLINKDDLLKMLGNGDERGVDGGHHDHDRSVGAGQDNRGVEGSGRDHGIGDKNNLPENPQEMTNAQAKQVLLDEFDNAEIRKNGDDRDGIIGDGDLKKLADDPTTDPHLREAAQRALDDPNFRAGMDTKDGGDIHLTKESIANSMIEDEKVSDAAGLVLEEFDNVEIRKNGGDRDGKIGLGDLEKLVADPSTDPELAEAAQTLLDRMEETGERSLYKDDLEKMLA